MSDNNLEKEFDLKISQVKTGGSGSLRADSDCMNILKNMSSNPTYSLGSVRPILNEKIDSYCKATGRSYESVIMELSVPKFK